MGTVVEVSTRAMALEDDVDATSVACTCDWNSGDGPPLAADALCPGAGVLRWIGLKISDAAGAGMVRGGKWSIDCLRDNAALDS